MAVVEMDAARVAELRAAPLTYSTVGVTTTTTATDSPARWSRPIGSGSESFHRAAQALLHWRAHSGAGLRVVASSPAVAVGEVVELYLGVGRLAFRAPCRVVAVLDDARRRGFAYGTLPGHPETGEEAFLLDHAEDDSVTFSVVAAARSASLIARLGGPITGAVRAAVIGRYLAALAE